MRRPSRRLVLIRSVQDEMSMGVDDPEVAVDRGARCMRSIDGDLSDDEPLVRRVCSVGEFFLSRGSRLIEPVGPAPVAAVSGSLHDSESDTESVPGIDRWTRRRLNLVWRANSPDSVPVQNHADAPDSHDQRLFRVRRATQMERQEAPMRAEPPCTRRG